MFMEDLNVPKIKQNIMRNTCMTYNSNIQKCGIYKLQYYKTKQSNNIHLFTDGETCDFIWKRCRGSFSSK